MSNQLYKFNGRDNGFCGDADEKHHKKDKRKISKSLDNTNTESGDTSIDIEFSEDFPTDSKVSSDEVESVTSSQTLDIKCSSNESDTDNEKTLAASVESSPLDEVVVDQEVSPCPPVSIDSNAHSEDIKHAKLPPRPPPQQKKTKSRAAPARGPVRRKQKRSFSPVSFSFTNSNRRESQTSTVGNFDDFAEVGVADLAAALHQLSRDSRFRSIRPPWRDPNSRPLPSDETASVEAMLKEYNNLLIANSEAGMRSDSGVADKGKVAVRRPYHSTLNRWRQQERIQMENFLLANRLRNIRPTPETSREVLLKRHKEYFITPVTARSLTSLPSCTASRPDSGLGATPTPTTSAAASANRRRCSSAVRPRSSARSAQSLRPATAASSSVNNATATTSANSANRRSRRDASLLSREVLDSLDSVRRALYEQRARGKL